MKHIKLGASQLYVKSEFLNLKMASKQNAESSKETSKTSEKDTEPELQGK